jgi:hypothetical protein
LAGGGLTTALPDLDTAIPETGARTVIPMRHQTPSLLYECGAVEDFLDPHPETSVVRHAGRPVEVGRDALPGELAILLLQPRMAPATGGGA